MLEFKPTPGVKHKDVYLCVFDATKKAMYLTRQANFQSRQVEATNTSWWQSN
jgi:hypothetical protein